MLAGVAAAGGLSPDAIAEVGRAQGRADAADRQSAGACVDALMGELSELGFDPAAATDGQSTSVAFTHCPFRELAEAFPDVVCHLHRGIVEGFVDAVGGVAVTEFATLADRDPCRVELSAR
jgi:predicted ArsR family transcriptional regulator